MEVLRRYANYYDNVTTLHPVAVALLVFAIILVFVLPRRRIFVPVILLTCLVPAAQRVVVFGADFHFLRVMILFAWARVLIRGEQRKLIWNNLDRAVIAWILAVAVATVLRQGSAGAIVNRSGLVFDCLGIYFLGRMTIRTWKDMDALIVGFIIISIPIAAFSIYEVRTETNPFHIFGQANYEAITRNGRVRALGAFSHQILAGSYWVAFLPLIVARFWQRGSKLLTGVGLAASLIIIVNSASSTPLLAAGVTAIGGGCYVLRRRMRQVRWGIVIALILIQLMMAKPIWHLLFRAGSVGLGSSTGYHRYKVIEAFVNNFKQWAVMGVNNTASWGRQLEDVTNHFVVQGVTGGLLGFVLFIAVFSFAFQLAGKGVKAAHGRRDRVIYAWGLGVALLGHVAMMNSTAYFGQILFPFYVTLAAVSSLATVRERKRSSSGSTREAAPTTSGGTTAAEVLGSPAHPIPATATAGDSRAGLTLTDLTGRRRPER